MSVKKAGICLIVCHSAVRSVALCHASVSTVTHISVCCGQRLMLSVRLLLLLLLLHPDAVRVCVLSCVGMKLPERIWSRRGQHRKPGCDSATRDKKKYTTHH